MTFYAFLNLADLASAKKTPSPQPAPKTDILHEHEERPSHEVKPQINLDGLHYNIQIHLPATKDVEVFNAIFKSLKEHLID